MSTVESCNAAVQDPCVCWLEAREMRLVGVKLVQNRKPQITDRSTVEPWCLVVAYTAFNTPTHLLNIHFHHHDNLLHLSYMAHEGIIQSIMAEIERLQAAVALLQ